MKARALAAIAAAIAIVALLAPATAAARTRHAGRKHHPTVVASFYVQGSHGYGVGVSLRNGTALSLSAVATKGPSIVLAEDRLRARQAPGSDLIKASLGKLGRIAMRFVPESVREEEPLLPACKGELDTVETGHFVGLFEFHGEHGYTRARATRASGTVTIAPPPGCHRSAKGAPHHRGPRQRASLAGRALAALVKAKGAGQAEVHALLLKARTENPDVQLLAARISGPDKKGKDLALDSFIAGASRDRGRIREESGVIDFLIRGPYFKVPDITHLTEEGVVKPPAPFSGIATYRRESPRSLTWTGDLSVNLPGFGDVSLAGRKTSVTVCADSGCRSKK